MAKSPACSRIDSGAAGEHAQCGPYNRAGLLKHYRINKLSKLGGIVIKKRDVLAKSDNDAVQLAADSPDCPVCDVLKDGQHVGSII